MTFLSKLLDKFKTIEPESRVVTPPERLSPSEQLRQSDPFKRLQSRLKTSNRNYVVSGLQPNSLTFGELVDAASLYVNGVNGGRDMAGSTLKRLVDNQFPEGVREKARVLVFQSLNLQPGIDADDEAYNFQINISIPKVYPYSIEIAHNPGGLSIMEKSPTDTSIVFSFDNRQGEDDGKGFVVESFRAVGLPTQSRITSE